MKVVVAYCEFCDEGRVSSSGAAMELWARTHAVNLKPGNLHYIFIKEAEIETHNITIGKGT